MPKSLDLGNKIQAFFIETAQNDDTHFPRLNENNNFIENSESSDEKNKSSIRKAYLR